MLTRNFKQAALTKYGINSTSGSASYVKLIDGSEMQVGNNSLVPHINIGGSGSACAASIRIGSGSTPPSYEDYCLEIPIDIIPSSVNLVKDPSYAKGASRFVAVFVNNTDAEITVSESVLSYGVSSPTAETRAYVVAREVFDPITVPVGGSVTITMTID